MKTLVVLALVIVGCTSPKRSELRPLPVVPVEVKVAKVVAPSLPTDEQVMRDAQVELIKWAGMGLRVKNPTISTKAVDKFEKDSSFALVQGRTNQGDIRIFLTYQMKNDFFRLVQRDSRIYPRD